MLASLPVRLRGMLASLPVRLRGTVASSLRGYGGGVLRAVRYVVIPICIVSTACAGSPQVPPGPITSSEIASALARPREHRDAPLGVHDEDGRPYALSLDEPVLGPAPPDGAERVTSVRVLSEGCDSVYGPLPGAGPCWLRRPFTVLPTTTAAAAPEPSPGLNATERALGAFVIVGTLSGTIICGIKCPEPWDTAVPIGVGTLVVATLVVGAVLMSKSIVVR